MEYVLDLLWPLSLTILIEYPIVQLLWLIIKDDDQKSKLVFCKNMIIIIPALIVNTLTNPAINIYARYLFLNSGLLQDDCWKIITILEFVIWAIEAVLYKFLLKTKWSKAFILAISANFVSYMASFFI